MPEALSSDRLKSMRRMEPSRVNTALPGLMSCGDRTVRGWVGMGKAAQQRENVSHGHCHPMYSAS